ncbi:hypothetical protein ACFQDG_16020, partial [Natronoarchaeum mannanilyticum]
TLADARYFVGWAFGAVLVLTGWSAMLAATNQNVLGLLAVVVAFYLHLAGARVAAEGYRRSVGLHRRDDRSESGRRRRATKTPRRTPSPSPVE